MTCHVSLLLCQCSHRVVLLAGVNNTDEIYQGTSKDKKMDNNILKYLASKENNILVQGEIINNVIGLKIKRKKHIKT